MTAIRAAVLRAPHAPFSVEAARLEAPGPGEVLVELAATGICHSDIAIVEQILPLPTPFVLGHEGAGVVREVGREVKGLKPGDHVVLTFASCGACAQCSDGHPAYCDAAPLLNFGGRRPDGSVTIRDSAGEPLNAAFFGQSSFATHALAAARNTIKVRQDAPLELLGPFGCGFMTGAGTVLNVLKPGKRETVVILGAGAVGFAAMFAARISGCERVVMVDRVKSRLELATQLGATGVIDTSTDDLDERLMSLGGCDNAIDTTGVPKVVEAVIRCLKVRGRLVLVGASSARTFSADILNMISGKVIMGAVEGDSDPEKFIPLLVEHFLAGRFPVDRLVTRYRFDDINTAVADASSGKAIKPILSFA